jgi:hypothetical protein
LSSYIVGDRCQVVGSKETCQEIGDKPITPPCSRDNLLRIELTSVAIVLGYPEIGRVVMRRAIRIAGALTIAFCSQPRADV